MRFISNGDYSFPLHFKPYWFQQVYMWSYQHGAPNPDGIMRLPGRLPDVLVFAAFGNLAVAYFYAATCLLITFLGFFWFAKRFLEVQRRGTQLLGALFFTCNPIFLGNLSKVGLIVAVAMLPVALTALKVGFEKRRFSYFLLYVLSMNISLVHPFTFSVNLLVSGAYLVFACRTHKIFIRDHIYKFGLVVLTALLVNAYLILPLLSLGTLSKSALSNTVASAPVNYTSLVDVANTGDIFTGLSLSKGVLKDYEFYGTRTWPFYFLGVFAFYVILFGVYVSVGKRARPQDKRYFVWSLAVFLALLALSTATFLDVGSLIKFMIGLPGGWMFRSPLKWQLYMPMSLFTALVIALKYVLKGKGLRWLYAGLLATFVLMNSYLFVQIYDRLLTPRGLNNFAALASANLEQKNLLFVDSNACMTYARNNPTVATELNQVLISKNVQVKNVEAGNIDAIALGQYDYVLGCQGALDETILTKRYAFTKTATFVDTTYALYRNTKPVPYVRAVSNTYSLDQQAGTSSLGGKYAFGSSASTVPFTFIESVSKSPSIGLQDMFDALSPASIHKTVLQTSITPLQPGEQYLYLTHKQPLYYTTKNNSVMVSTVRTAGSKAVESAPLRLSVAAGQHIAFSYNDPSFSYKNIIPNPSLEQGLWQKNVGDCNAYDNQPNIVMRLDKTARSQGNQSLQLAAVAHIACSGPPVVSVQAGEHYLLHFDYASSGGQYAGYHVGFNMEPTSQTPTEAKLASTDGAWTPFTTEVAAPSGATQAQLILYAYPDSSAGGWGKANYDNVSLTRIPNIKNHFFVTSKPLSNAAQPTIQTSFTVLNPTKTLVNITAVRGPFYLSTKESYNALWQLQANSGAHGLSGLFAAKGAAVDQQDHLRMNGSMNGWYIDPQAFCAQASADCTRSGSGSYDLHLVMAYAPQRWFEIGCLVSAVATSGAVSYVIYEVWRHRRTRGARR